MALFVRPTLNPIFERFAIYSEFTHQKNEEDSAGTNHREGVGLKVLHEEGGRRVRNRRVFREMEKNAGE